MSRLQLVAALLTLFVFASLSAATEPLSSLAEQVEHYLLAAGKLSETDRKKQVRATFTHTRAKQERWPLQ